jgi:hypothetical protein
MSIWEGVNSGKLFIFHGDRYSSYDINNGLDWESPRQIIEFFRDLPYSFTSDLDAVFIWSGKAYFFKGDEYCRYDIFLDRCDPGYPAKISNETWPGLLFTDKIDAVSVWADGTAYFFKGNYYLKYNMNENKCQSTEPRLIAGNWTGVQFSGDIDAICSWPTNNKLYFVKGGQYYQYDLERYVFDAGFPLPVNGNWAGLHIN